MSYVIAAPEYLATAATDLSNIGTALNDANSAALGPVSGVLPAGADEVSASIAALFGAHAQAYQAISAAAQAFHTQFVQLMSGGAEQYVLAEAANATPLQTVGSGLLTDSTATGQVLNVAQPVAGSAASAAGSAPLAAAG
ncbi:PE family protein, partial [Mycobacterium conspicuum]